MVENEKWSLSYCHIFKFRHPLRRKTIFSVVGGVSRLPVAKILAKQLVQFGCFFPVGLRNGLHYFSNKLATKTANGTRNVVGFLLHSQHSPLNTKNIVILLHFGVMVCYYRGVKTFNRSVTRYQWGLCQPIIEKNKFFVGKSMYSEKVALHSVGEGGLRYSISYFL